MLSANIYCKTGTDPIPPFTLAAVVAAKLSGMTVQDHGKLKFGEAVRLYEQYAKTHAHLN